MSPGGSGSGYSVALEPPRRMTAQDRADAFSQRFPDYAKVTVHNGAIYGFWLMGASYYRRTSYYGEFPNKMKERIQAIFPDCHNILHLFSGKANDLNAITYDLESKMKPTICDHIYNIGKYADRFKQIQLAIADPPYEDHDFKRYNALPFSKPKALERVGKALPKGAFLAWLDVQIPMWSKRYWRQLGMIGVGISTNTRVRALLLLERV